MFSSSQTGRVITSVQLHPVKLLILGLAFLLVGIAIAVDAPWFVIEAAQHNDMLSILVGFFMIPFGFAGAFVGGKLIYIGARQIIRCMRTFLS